MSEKEKEEYKTYIPTIAQKFMGKGLLKAAGLIPDESQEVPESEEVPFKYFTLPAELPEEALADISTTVAGLMTILGAEEFKAVRDAFTFAEYKDGRLGLGVAGNIGALFGFGEEEKLDVDAMVLFNKKGELNDERIKILLNSKIRIDFGAIPYSRNQIMIMDGNVGKFVHTFGPIPHTDFLLGLQKTINSFICESI